MAKKDKEEEKKDVDQSAEEDFGLPDLEFEELDDIDEEEFNEEDLENVEEEIAELIGETSDEDELSLDDIGVGEEISDIGDDTEQASDEPSEEVEADSNEVEALDDIGAVTDSDTDIPDESAGIEDEGAGIEDEGAGIEQELQKETIDEELDEVEKFISEITADDVDEDSSSYGVDTEPADSESSGEFASATPSYEESDYKAEVADGGGGTTKGFTRIIIFGLVSAVALAFAFLYWHNEGADSGPVAGAESTPEVTEPPAESQPSDETPGEAQPADTQSANEQPAQEKPAATQPAPAQNRRPAAQQPRQTTPAATPGEITVINTRANRYYIVVGSFIDEDMATDMGKELAAQGVAVKIVHPFNERKYYRVAVADYGTLNEAVNARNSFKSQYGEDIWALKY